MSLNIVLCTERKTYINLERNESYYQPDDLNRDGVVEEGERDDDNDGVPNKYDEEEEDFDDDFGERSLF